MFTKKVEIIGIGYIGLPLALLLAKNGVSVLGVDINKKLINQISEG
ncbi:MAG: nucleotide sugar dehydrogenase, partial [Candidatus Heimdallarchaeaceae archaeon]